MVKTGWLHQVLTALNLDENEDLTALNLDENEDLTLISTS